MRAPAGVYAPSQRGERLRTEHRNKPKILVLLDNVESCLAWFVSQGVQVLFQNLAFQPRALALPVTTQTIALTVLLLSSGGPGHETVHAQTKILGCQPGSEHMQHHNRLQQRFFITSDPE